MDYFDLPVSTMVQRVVPKNSFDASTNSKQKDLFTKEVARIIWSNKLSSETINLSSREIQEIQVFVVELKKQKEIKGILDVIDKVIPYHIIFIVEYGDCIYLSASSKHPSPLNEAKSVIDWTFQSGWMKKDENRYEIKLRKSIDNVFYEFCSQLSPKYNEDVTNITDLIAYNSKINLLTKEIEKLKKNILTCQQFNKKVELNLRLKELEQELVNI